MNENLELTKTLEFIGFSEKEVLVYLALLELGKGTVTQISRKAGINRPTGYHVLASLEVKELVRVSGKEPKQEYVAESPDQIEKLLVKKIESDQAFIKEARKIIPELKSMHNVKKRLRTAYGNSSEFNAAAIDHCSAVNCCICPINTIIINQQSKIGYRSICDEHTCFKTNSYALRKIGYLPFPNTFNTTINSNR